MRDEKGLLHPIEDEAAIHAAGADIEILERQMLDGGSREKLTLAQAILAAQDISYEPVRAVGMLEELARESGDRMAAREAAEMLGGRYDGAEEVHAAEYTRLLEEAARAEKKYKKQNPGRLTLIRAGFSAAVCAVLALAAWFWLSDAIAKVTFLHLAGLGLIAGVLALIAVRHLLVGGLVFAAVTGCLAAMRYHPDVSRQLPLGAAALFGLLAAVYLVQFLLALRRSRQTGKQEKARRVCFKAYDAAIAYAEAGIAAAESLSGDEPTAALQAYLKHWSDESRRLTRQRRRVEKIKPHEPAPKDKKQKED
ncbi:MAG: hypothetical protein IKM54_03040 [Butyricicoccus sp.]|nr:hypothetical protein [Butyricicoccus sp.]